MIIKRKGLIDMKNIENLMLVSKQGDFYSSQKLMAEFGLNKNELKIIMESMGFEAARKYVINENGEKVRVRGYVCVSPSKVVEEETETVAEETEPTAYDENGEALSDEEYQEIIANTKKIAEVHVNQLVYYLLYGCNDVETYEEVKGFAYDDMVALGYY